MIKREPISIDEVTCPKCGAAAQIKQYETTDNPMGDCPQCRSLLARPGYWGRLGKVQALPPKDKWVALG